MNTSQITVEEVSTTPSTASDDVEVWLDIPGYETRYQASNLGRIKSLRRKVRSVNHYTGRDFQRTIQERILRPAQYCKSGHLSVVLEHGGIGQPVHQLVLKAFIGETPVGLEILHINGNPTDNRLVNLRYGSRTENILDTYYQGGRWRKLSVDDVGTIRFSLYCGMRGVDLANEYQVSETTISNIKNRRIFWWLK